MKKLLMVLFFVSQCYAMERVSFVSGGSIAQRLSYGPRSPKIVNLDWYTRPPVVEVTLEEQARAFDHLMELHNAILPELVPARRAFKIKEMSDYINDMNLQLYSAVMDDERIPRACRLSNLTFLSLKKDSLLDECSDVWDVCRTKRAKIVAREKAVAEGHQAADQNQQTCCSIQ
jgi:hypothetical protein